MKAKIKVTQSGPYVRMEVPHVNQATVVPLQMLSGVGAGRDATDLRAALNAIAPGCVEMPDAPKPAETLKYGDTTVTAGSGPVGTVYGFNWPPAWWTYAKHSDKPHRTNAQRFEDLEKRFNELCEINKGLLSRVASLESATAGRLSALEAKLAEPNPWDAPSPYGPSANQMLAALDNPNIYTRVDRTAKPPVSFAVPTPAIPPPKSSAELAREYGEAMLNGQCKNWSALKDDYRAAVAREKVGG